MATEDRQDRINIQEVKEKAVRSLTTRQRVSLIVDGHQPSQGNAYGGPQGHYPGDQFGQGQMGNSQAGNFAGQGGPNQYNPQ